MKNTASPKLRITLFVALIAGIIGVAGVVLRPTPITNAPPARLGIVAFGDSLTAGVGASPGHDYPSVLSQIIGREVINRGVSGDTTADALKRLDRDVLALDPGIVIVILGGNDFLRKVPEKEVEKNLTEIITRIQEKGAVVILGEMRGPAPGMDYGNLYKRLARRHGTVLVPDILGEILTHPKLKSDPIHPNDAGYEIIARRVAEKLEPLLMEASRNQRGD